MPSNFGYSTAKPLVKTRCTECGEEREMPHAISIPSKYIGDITVPSGKVIGKCNCGGEAQAIGQLIKFLPKGNVLIGELAAIEADKERLQRLTGDWNVVFTTYNVASQKLNTNNEHMNGTVPFQIWRQSDAGREMVRTGVIVVRQPSGESRTFMDGPIEVELPEFIRPLVNYLEIRDAVEDYIRSLFGEKGLVDFGPGAPGRFKDVSFTRGASKIYPIKAIDQNKTAW